MEKKEEIKYLKEIKDVLTLHLLDEESSVVKRVFGTTYVEDTYYMCNIFSRIYEKLNPLSECCEKEVKLSDLSFYNSVRNSKYFKHTLLSRNDSFMSMAAMREYKIGLLDTHINKLKKEIEDETN